MITALPITFVCSSPPMVQSVAVTSSLPVPSSPTSRLAISPLWKAPPPARFPWASCWGFQWPPAEVASGALQSPDSCKWTACVPGVAPFTVSVIFTPPFDSSKIASPVNVLPLALWIVALALPALGPHEVATRTSKTIHIDKTFLNVVINAMVQFGDKIFS